MQRNIKMHVLISHLNVLLEFQKTDKQTKKHWHTQTRCLLDGETMLLLGEGVENFKCDTVVEVSVG